MRVKLLVEFDVEPCDDDDDGDDFSAEVARSAASQAVYDYLAFTTMTGVNVGRDEARVHVDGFGDCIVRIGEEHE